jgi:arylsulfate sulfotransferase
MRNTWASVDLIRFALGAAIGVLLLFLPLGCGGGGAPTSASTNGSPTTSPSGGAGQVATTHNPQAALYTVTSPKDGMVSVSFGKTASYDLLIASQPISAGKAVSLYVAGMLATSTYHMQAAIRLTDGSTITDLDHTFTTGSLPAQFNLLLNVNATSGISPQPGIEMLNVYGSTGTGAVATDLSGNPLWTYYLPDGPPNALLFPIDLLPNGHILFVVEGLAQANYDGSSTAPVLSFLREVDLAGTVIRQLTVQDLNARLATAAFNVQLWSFHHDILALPNGHLIVMSNSIRQMTGLAGQSGSVPVLGDVIVDLDTNLQPVWVWNSFDHLDINRQPMLFSDWTHGNALLYSPSDGQLLISMRHQNWILKLDYRDGLGSGVCFGG